MESQFKFTDLVFIARLFSVGFAAQTFFGMLWFSFDVGIIFLCSGFISIFAYIFVAAWPRKFLKMKYARIVMLVFCITGIFSIGAMMFLDLSIGEWMPFQFRIFFIIPFFIIFYEMIIYKDLYKNTAPNKALKDRAPQSGAT